MQFLRNGWTYSARNYRVAQLDNKVVNGQRCMSALDGFTDTSYTRCFLCNSSTRDVISAHFVIRTDKPSSIQQWRTNQTMQTAVVH